VTNPAKPPKRSSLAGAAQAASTEPAPPLRLLLTSGGVQNESLKAALTDLIGKPFDQADVVFIPTAAVAVSGHQGWLVEDLNRVYALGWREFNTLELNGLPRPMVLDRLRHADVIYAEGGNPYHLARSIIANDLADDMAGMLGTKVYVGVSAGSMIFSKQLTEQTAEAMGDIEDLRELGETRARSPFGFFDWYLKPHLHSPQFPNRDDAWLAGLAEKLSFPIYAIDDQSAVRVRGGEVDVVSEGLWRIVNG
jgi:dipeptidase E